MDTENLLAQARRTAGMSQDELARRAHTSSAHTVSYENGHKFPLWRRAARLLAKAGFEFTIQPRVQFVEQTTPRGRAVSVPTSLPRLPIEQALATVALPLHLNWSAPGRQFSMRDRPSEPVCMRSCCAKGESRGCAHLHRWRPADRSVV
jgi:DNA-binding XRE family transcriptional regulator